MTCQIPVAVDCDGLDGIEEWDAKLDARTWYLYRYASEVEPRHFPSLLATTNREKSKLIDIIEETTAMLYTLSTACITAHHILELYSRFARWRDELPDVLKNLGSRKIPALPHVLSLWYV
jgi:hypothetical protein